MRWISFPKARNFTPYKVVLLCTLDILGDDDKNRLQLLPVNTSVQWLCSGAEICVSFGTKSLRERPPKDSMNSEVKLCLHNVDITSEQAFSSCRPPHHGYECLKDSSPPGLEFSYCLTVTAKAVPGIKPQGRRGQHLIFCIQGKKACSVMQKKHRHSHSLHTGLPNIPVFLDLPGRKRALFFVWDFQRHSIPAGTIAVTRWL